MADLDRLLARARGSVIRRDVIDAGVSATRRAAQPRPRSGPRWIRAVVAAIAAAALGVAWAARMAAPVPPPVPAGDHAANAVTAPVQVGSAMTAPAPPPPPPVVPVPVGSPEPPIAPAPKRAPAPRPRPAIAVAPDLAEQWRIARRRRAAGDLTGALADCLAIADARDPIWTPIAELEAARIELGPLAQVEAARALAQRVLDDWPASALAPEARELRCRALVQLGRPCP